MQLRVIVVDDEPLAREGVMMHLQNETDVTVVAQCGNAAEAVTAIQTFQPDLVFLDVKMPNGNGFDVVNMIGPDNMPMVTFLTAYDEFAIDAFKINALDYLLKPINPELFKESLNRARLTLQKDKLSEHTQHLTALLSNVGNSLQVTEQDQRIVVRTHGHVHFVRPEEILWVEADGDYINMHTANRAHLIRETMRNMEQRLAPYGFQRIHRSVIVKLELISELITSDNGDYEVVISEGKRLKLSRNYRDTLFEKLNARS